MHPYPHTYVAGAAGTVAGMVAVSSGAAPALETAPPPEFDGPEGVWSPESLLCAAVADCFILSFRGVSRAARMSWVRLECRVEGVLERVERQSQFTRFRTIAHLVVPEGTDPERARHLLEQAEAGCLVANSLRGARSLETEVTVASG